MRIAVPTEVKNNEFRVAITPVGVHELVRRGHEVYIQAGAGIVKDSVPEKEYLEILQKAKALFEVVEEVENNAAFA